MNIIGFVISDVVFVVVTILSIRKCSKEDKDNKTIHIDDWLFPLLIFISIVVSEVMTVFSPYFKGQIASEILTGTSVLAGIVLIVLIGIHSNLEGIEVNIQDDDEIHDEVFGWIISMLGILYFSQTGALILHIIHIHIPQIIFLANLNL